MKLAEDLLLPDDDGVCICAEMYMDENGGVVVGAANERAYYSMDFRHSFPRRCWFNSKISIFSQYLFYSKLCQLFAVDINILC